MAPQIFQTGSREAMAEAKEDDPGARQHHGDNRHHLHQRQPELHLAEHPHVAQVHGTDKEDDAEDPDPARDIGIPQSHIDAEGGDIGQGDDHHFKSIGPAGNKPGQRPEILAGVAAEGAGNRVAHRHLAQRAHDDKHRRAANQIGQQHRRARRLDGGGRAIEQPGADSGAERNKSNVSGIEPAQQMWLVLLLHIQVSWFFYMTTNMRCRAVGGMTSPDAGTENNGD